MCYNILLSPASIVGAGAAVLVESFVGHATDQAGLMGGRPRSEPYRPGLR